MFELLDNLEDVCPVISEIDTRQVFTYRLTLSEPYAPTDVTAATLIAVVQNDPRRPPTGRIVATVDPAKFPVSRFSHEEGNALPSGTVGALYFARSRLTANPSGGDVIKHRAYRLLLTEPLNGRSFLRKAFPVFDLPATSPTLPVDLRQALAAFVHESVELFLRSVKTNSVNRKFKQITSSEAVG